MKTHIRPPFFLLFTLVLIALLSYAIDPAMALTIPSTGMTISSVPGDDGDLEKGVAWLVPRFTGNGNGTIMDKPTGLIWIKDGNCTKFYAEDATGQNNRPWEQAVEAVNKLASTPGGLYCGLTDGSVAGIWRLPNRKELDSLLDMSTYNPALPLGHPFTNTVPASYYWTSTNIAFDTTSRAWCIHFENGNQYDCRKSDELYIRAVRDRQ